MSPQDNATKRYQEERQFQDALAHDGHRRGGDRFYAVNESSWTFYRSLLLDEAHRSGESPRILEYGTGIEGYSSRVLAEAGYDVTGIDLSPESVQAARRRAPSLPAGSVTYAVMNAEQLEFPPRSFDLVCGNGILHHLDLARAYGEVARVLRAEGTAVFSEPLGHNPLINLYRRRTPDQRTPDEHPLLVGDLELARRYFARVEARFFHLFVLAAVPFRSTALFRPILAALDALDRAVLRAIPPLRKHAWYVVVRLSGPLASTSETSDPQPGGAEP